MDQRRCSQKLTADPRDNPCVGAFAPSVKKKMNILQLSPSSWRSLARAQMSACVTIPRDRALRLYACVVAPRFLLRVQNKRTPLIGNELPRRVSRVPCEKPLMVYKCTHIKNADEQEMSVNVLPYVSNHEKHLT